MREKNPITLEEKLAYLRELREQAVHSASEEAVEKQHAKGKLTARERVEKLLDPGSFEELDTFVRHRTHEFEMDKKRPWGDAVVTGYGTIDGRPMFVFSQDFTVFGGSLGEVMAEKMCKVMDLAAKVGAPVIGLNDSGGARIQEGVVSLGAYGDVFVRNVQCSGVIPQISAIMGPCAGGAVYSPAMTDFIFMVKETSHMFITGPEVIKTVTGEEVEFEELGGAMTHNSKSGVAHFAAEDEEQCLEDIRYLIGFLPLNNLETAAAGRALRRPRARGPRARLDRPGRSAEALRHARRGRAASSTTASSSRCRSTSRSNIIVGFSRLDGIRSGSSATSPRTSPGCSTSRPPRRRRGSCASATPSTSRSSPSPTCPGFLPGTSQEWNGIIRHGAKLLYAFTEATVPKLTVVTRKAYGGAYDVMNSKHMLADFNFAWPQAEVAVMGPEGAVNIIYRKDISQSPTPDERRAEADRRLQGALREPLLGRRARLHRRRDRAARDAAEADPRAAHAADQAGRAAEAQARQHPALMRLRRRARAAAFEALESRLAFIYGSGRSGSTWLLRLLIHPLEPSPMERSGFTVPDGAAIASGRPAIPVNEPHFGTHLAPFWATPDRHDKVTEDPAELTFNGIAGAGLGHQLLPRRELA